VILQAVAKKKLGAARADESGEVEDEDEDMVTYENE